MVGFGLIIAGFILTLSDSGKLAIGEDLTEDADETTKSMYMINSGKFVWNYLIFILVWTAVVILSVCCCCCVGCVAVVKAAS